MEIDEEYITKDRITRKPCVICGNTTRGELNRHHLIEKFYRKKNTAQLTIKLCRDKQGCMTHYLFHCGTPEQQIEAGKKIRLILEPADIAWMESVIDREWVDKTYPK